MFKGYFQAIVLWMIPFLVSALSFPCALRDYGNGKLLCVCNSTYCDTLESLPYINSGEYVIFTSSKEGQRFNKTVGNLSSVQTSSPQLSRFSGSSPINIEVNPKKKYQNIMGFGGAFTDSAGININSLTKTTKEFLLRSYFSEVGIEYNLCRLPVGGTDFSTHPYSYDDGPTDPQLQKFSLAKEDLKYKIPLIQAAMNMSLKVIHLVAAVWSPPPWMKTNNQFSGLAFLRKEYYDAYAKYIIRFLDEYSKHGLFIWAVSTGNEPSNGVIPFKRFNSLGWTPNTISRWITDYFGPQLRNSTHDDTLILAFDDQRLFLPWWIDLMVETDKNVLKYIDGFAIHWYWDFLIGPGVLSDLQGRYPQQFILYTEASQGDKPWEKKVDFGSWERGEKYIADIIENLNANVTGWMDWNLALDMSGGPTWAKNYVDSPILVNATADEFYKQPMYYALGHVSKFIERDAQRLQVLATNLRKIHVMAVENPEGMIIIVLSNENDKKTDVSINVTGKGAINLILTAHSFATVLC